MSKSTSKYFSKVKYDNNRLYFTMKCVGTAIPNALRRIMQAETPTYAIDLDSMVIKENSTIFHNERISHNLLMIPVNNDLKDRDYDSVSFSLEAVFDSKNVNTDSSSYEEKVIVYSDDIKSSDGHKYFMNGVPIIELRKKDKIIIDEFRLKKGYQREHIAFQAAIVEYEIKNIDEVRTNEDAVVEVDFEIIPRTVQNKISYPWNTRKVFINSINIIIEKIDNLLGNIDNIIIDIQPDSDFATIIIEDEDDTMGYLLQSYIMDTPEFKNKRYVGYRNVHPLKRIVEMKMTHPEPKGILISALNNLGDIFKTILKEIKGNIS